MARSRTLKVVKGKGQDGRSGGSALLSQTDVAVGVLRDRIIDLTLEPGSKIDERLLMHRFKLGRTPAREALNRLCSEGFVKIHRNKGAFVAPLDLNQVRQFFEAYFAAERMSAYFCNCAHAELVDDLGQIQAEHEQASQARDYLRITAANTAFHTRIAQACENEYIYEFSARLHLQARRLSQVIYAMEQMRASDRDRHGRRIEQHHRAMIAAIRNGDTPELIDLVTRHAQLFNDRIVRVLAEAQCTDLTFVTPGQPV